MAATSLLSTRQAAQIERSTARICALRTRTELYSAFHKWFSDWVLAEWGTESWSCNDVPPTLLESYAAGFDAAQLQPQPPAHAGS